MTIITNIWSCPSINDCSSALFVAKHVKLTNPPTSILDTLEVVEISIEFVTNVGVPGNARKRVC